MRLKRIISKAVTLGLSCSLLVPPGPVLADTAASAAPTPAAQSQPQRFPLVQLPPGFQIEKVAEGLTYLSGMTFDDQGRLYVLEAGGAFLDLPAPARILRVEPGRVTEIANLTATGIAPSAVGITWHNGAFLISHRDGQDRTGAVSRVTLDGQRTQLFSGIIDSQAEHQVNDIKIGPDGMAYLAVGPATNAGIVGIDLAPFYKRSPTLQHRPCQDIVLTGRNFRTPDFRTDTMSDVVDTGAFQPFGVQTTPGQVIPGVNKCGGAILRFDPNNAEATIRPFAHGLRNVIGLSFNAQGELFAAVNGYDIRGSRSVNDEWDATYRIREGAWYGWPDFSAALEPVSERKFEVPNELQAPIFIKDVLQGKNLNPLIDLQASGLTRPDKSLIAGLHLFNSSPSGIDIAPASWGDMAGQVFAAEWGDLSPPTNPLKGNATGSQITRLDPQTKLALPFASNKGLGPASALGAPGMGLERPFDVQFGPDGAMYISDYGIARINPARIAEGHPPYEFPEGTGIIWRISRTGASPAELPHAIDGRTLFDEAMSTKMMFFGAFGDRALEEWAAQHTAAIRAAEGQTGSATYRVTIENLTQGQPFSPPVLASHRAGFDVFEVGQVASDQIAAIAQDGNPGPMYLFARNSNQVTEAVNTGALVPPKKSITREIRANPGDRLSMASMLICTNDGFWGLDAVALPDRGSQTFTSIGYDAGREQNTENTLHVVDTCSIPRPLPGDNDGNQNVPVATNPPQPIQSHPGIKGQSDPNTNSELDPAFHGFSGDVARVTVERIS